MIDFVRSWLDTHNVPYRLSFDVTGHKANLHATIGPVRSGGIAFSGHVDTVPVEGQPWTGDPYSLRRKEGRLIGRGVCDMKGFVAGMLASVPYIKSRQLRHPVHLFLTYDEEVGYHGARRLIDDIAESGLRPSACVIGEATQMIPIVAQKGRLVVRSTVHGHLAHSCEAHRGVNAVAAAAEAIAWLDADATRLANDGPFEKGFDPPYTLLNVTDFTCKAMPNTVPSQACFQFEWRNIPKLDPRLDFERFKNYVARQIEPKMKHRHLEAGFEHEVLVELGALSLPERHDIVQAALAITGAPNVGKISYCSEGSLFQPAGITTMVCGPGNVMQAHRPDEWIEEEELTACQNFICQLVDRLSV